DLMLKLLFFSRRHKDIPDLNSSTPNLKKGRGGLRNALALMYLARIWHGSKSQTVESLLDDLVSNGAISADERARLIEALNFVYALRNELHSLQPTDATGDAQDVLTEESQSRLNRKGLPWLGTTVLGSYRKQASVIAGVLDRVKDR